MDTLLVAVVSGAVCGLIAWGGVRVELRWLRADLKLHHERINRLESVLIGRGARVLANELHHNPGEHRS